MPVATERYTTVDCPLCGAAADFRGELGKDHDGEGLAVYLTHRDCDCDWTRTQENATHDRAHDAMWADA